LVEYITRVRQASTGPPFRWASLRTKKRPDSRKISLDDMTIVQVELALKKLRPIYLKTAIKAYLHDSTTKFKACLHKNTTKFNAYLQKLQKI
jgi:hypothetical protein